MTGQRPGQPSRVCDQQLGQQQPSTRIKEAAAAAAWDPQHAAHASRPPARKPAYYLTYPLLAAAQI